MSLVTVGLLRLTGSVSFGLSDYIEHIVWFVLFAPAALACLIGKMRGIRNKWNICLGLGYYAAAGLVLGILCSGYDYGHYYFGLKDGLSVFLPMFVCLTLSWFCLRYLLGSKDRMFAEGGKDAA